MTTVWLHISPYRMNSILLNEQVNAGIELLKAKDQEIAGEMNQWGTTSLLISSTLSKKERKLDHLEREFQSALGAR